MPYDLYLTDRIRNALREHGTTFEEKQMFGGICFMVDDKMCVGIIKNELMVRLDPDLHDQAVKREGARPMDFSGKSMKGFVYVTPEAIDLDSQLEAWIRLALEFNPRAKASKRK